MEGKTDVFQRSGSFPLPMESFPPCFGRGTVGIAILFMFGTGFGHPVEAFGRSATKSVNPLVDGTTGTIQLFFQLGDRG